MRRARAIAVAVGLTLTPLAVAVTGPADADPQGRPEASSRGSVAAVVRTISLPMGGLYSHYTMAPDGTFWVANGGASGLDVSHYDDQGNDLGDGFTQAGAIYVQSVGIWLDRIYITAGAQIRSWLTDGTGEVDSDPDTNQRLGGNQAIMRVSPDGGARIALGQSNKIVTMNFTSLFVDHPFYGQVWSGAGINSTAANINVFQSCVLVPGGPYSGTPDTNCGTYPGRIGPEGGRLNYPIDIAASGNTLAVLENGGVLDISRVTLINASGPNLSGGFGEFGSDSGDLKYPFSIVTQPSTGHYFISDPGNKRISEYTGGGIFVKSFGYGVDTGGPAFETCGVGLGTCQPGNGAALHERLDFGADGRLYAQYAGSTIQVIEVGSTTPPPPAKNQVRLKAKATKVAKGTRTKLTATVTPSATCTTRKVRFQQKNTSGWTNLGKARAVAAGCKTSVKSPKIKKKVKFRVVSILGGAALATSPVVTVKPKP